MGNNRKWIQISIFAVIVVVGALTIASNLFANNEKPSVGGKAPNFTLKSMDGETYELSDLKGKAVMVNFWGTFCEPCRYEMPAIQRQFDKWDKEKVVFLGVNLGESKVTVANFIEQYKVSFPILLDNNEETRKRYGVTQYPTTFFIGPDGKISDIHKGVMDDAIIEQKLAAITQ